MSPASRLPFLAPSQCPRHSPTSSIGGSAKEDERRFFVGGEAAREETPHPARDGKAARLESEPCATLNSGCCAMARERNVAQDPLSGPAAFPAGWFPSAPHNGKPVFRHIAWRPATPPPLRGPQHHEVEEPQGRRAGPALPNFYQDGKPRTYRTGLQCNPVNACYFGKHLGTRRRAEQRSASTRPNAVRPYKCNCGSAALRYVSRVLHGNRPRSAGIIILGLLTTAN